MGLAASLLAGCVVAPYRTSPASRSPAPVTQRNAPMYFYPMRGQDEAQLDRDRYACYRWASDQTGVMPGMTPVRAEPGAVPVESRAAERQGAATGAVIGATAGAVLSSGRHGPANAVLGAIFGAALGTMVGVQEDRARAVRAARPPAAAALDDDFRRAMSACMGGRGYRVG